MALLPALQRGAADRGDEYELPELRLDLLRQLGADSRRAL